MSFGRGITLTVLALFTSFQVYAQTTGEYLAGVRDRTEYESWFAVITGNYKTGVEFWVNHRSKPREAKCFSQGMTPDSEWMHGCLTAQQRMTPWDARRKADSEYRLGWNSIQSPEVQQAVRSRQGGLESAESLPTKLFPTPSQNDPIAGCSQEVSVAYDSGLVLDPAVRSQLQSGCVERHRQEAIRSAQAARDAELRAQAARESTRRQTEQASSEQSPNNNCRKPEFAKGLMESFNSFEAFKATGHKSVDIEHLTTVRWDEENLNFVCHGTFVLTNGQNFVGTLEIKPNVAGSMITKWRPDVVPQ